MGSAREPKWPALLLAWVVVFPWFGKGIRNGGGGAVRILKMPPAFSSSSSAEFEFEVAGGKNASRSAKCKVDEQSFSDCEGGKVKYTGLLDGVHRFEVCINGSGVRCVSYNWAVDTLPPTAYVTATSSFTNASNVLVNITFSEPCTGDGGFRCSVNDCNLLVYGAASIIPSTLKVLEPDKQYSLVVMISAAVQYGRLVLVMDKAFCTDASGNRFTRKANSSFFLHFDRRRVSMSIRTSVPQKLFPVNNVIRTVEATNNRKNLRVYMHFSSPVLNSSAEILGALQTSNGMLIPTNRNSLGNRRFGFLVTNISSIAVITVSVQTGLIISRQGTPVSPAEPTIFLYDAERPSVRLSTSSVRTREHTVQVAIKFVKPVFNFESSALLISGGRLQRFHEISRSTYTIEILLVECFVSLQVPENATGDVAGNRNLASNVLQVRHYSIPTVSSIFSSITTIVFVVTSFASALLSISTASLLSFGAFAGSSSYIISDPARNLMRIAYHLQIFAQSRWLVANLPTQYYEFARGIEWSIPYLSFPSETKSVSSFFGDSSFSDGIFSEANEAKRIQHDELFRARNGNFRMFAPQYGSPLTAMEYMTFFEDQNMKPEAEFIQNLQSPSRWKDFERHMFWLAVIGGSLMMLHGLILFTLKFRKKNRDENTNYGALVFPRFEIVLALLALPCICQASAAILKGHSTGGTIVGALLLGLVFVILTSIFVFISIGITLGKLLQYKEVHREGEKLHWYQGIMRACLGPGKRGQWTWKDRTDSYLTRFGPLFEDLRGPPMYMLSQISSIRNFGRRSANIVASDDETEDAEAPFIEKVFGILRIYYTLIESVKRASVGIVVGAFSAFRTSSKAPTVVVLSISSFQLFFLVLKKPFIKKKVQFAEVVSVAGEVGIFILCLLTLEKEFSGSEENIIGITMLALFMIGFIVQMINQWQALYRQVLLLSPDENSLRLGIKAALIGVLLICLPLKLLSGLDDRMSSDRTEGDTGSGASQGARSAGNSGGNERSWVRQLREIAKDSFSREDGRVPKDPSSSQPPKSGISSKPSSADYKEKAKALQKDLEAIFSSK